MVRAHGARRLRSRSRDCAINRSLAPPSSAEPDPRATASPSPPQDKQAGGRCEAAPCAPPWMRTTQSMGMPCIFFVHSGRDPGSIVPAAALSEALPASCALSCEPARGALSCRSRAFWVLQPGTHSFPLSSSRPGGRPTGPGMCTSHAAPVTCHALRRTTLQIPATSYIAPRERRTERPDVKRTSGRHPESISPSHLLAPCLRTGLLGVAFLPLL